VKSPRARATVGAASVVACVALALGIGREADAQRFDPRRPAVFVVGTPGGASPTFRGDAHRSGLAKEPLPSGALRIAWRKNIALSVDQPALVGADGLIAVVSASRGDVVFIDGEGVDVAHVTAGTSAVGPATMTSDGTVVFTTTTGEAVGVRRSLARPRFVARIGGERNVRAAPLSLDDGGVVVASAFDLVVLDAEGNVRARVSLPEAPAAPLVASGDKIIAVTATGAVFGWTPGREPVRVGSFGAPVDGAAALTPAGTLVAVIEGNHLVELDLARGVRSTRSISTAGLYLGPPSLRTLPNGATATTLLGLTPARGFVVTIDAAGQELARAPIASVTSGPLPDGGTAPLVAPPHVGPLVDGRGAVAFAATDGHVGMITADGAVDTIGELICTRSGSSAGIAGLTSYARGSFLVTCMGGAVVRVSGAEPDTRLRPSPATGTPAPP